MNLENIMLSEVRQRQTLYDRAYMWNLKINTNESICKTWGRKESDATEQLIWSDMQNRNELKENKLMVTKREKEAERNKLGVWD